MTCHLGRENVYVWGGLGHVGHLAPCAPLHLHHLPETLNPKPMRVPVARLTIVGLPNCKNKSDFAIGGALI